MKKKIIIIMGLCLVLLAGGCSRNSAGDAKSSTSSDKTANSGTSDNTDTSTKLAAVTGIPERTEYKASDYIKLGKYKGIEISVVKSKVTDQQVEDKIKSGLESSKTYEKTDKTTIKNGDIVNIDFEGIINGKAFAGGSASDYNLKIGSGQFIDGFEKGLIGKKVGKKVSLKLKFPSNYSNADYAGKAVTFNVTINYIAKEVTPELTDAYVTKNTKYKTVDEYKQALRKSMEVNQNDEYNTAYNTILKDSKVSSLPKELTQYYTDVMNYQYNTMAKNNGTDLESYLKKNNMTVDSFNKYVASYAEDYATSDLVVEAIAAAEKITVLDTELSDAVKSLMKQYSIDTEENLYNYMPKSEIKQNVLSSKVMDFIINNAKITYTDPTPTPAPTATTAPSK